MNDIIIAVFLLILVCAACAIPPILLRIHKELEKLNRASEQQNYLMTKQDRRERESIPEVADE